MKLDLNIAFLRDDRCLSSRTFKFRIQKGLLQLFSGWQGVTDRILSLEKRVGHFGTLINMS